MEAGPGLGGALLTPKGKETLIIDAFGVGVRQNYPIGAVSSIFRNVGLGIAYITTDERQLRPSSWSLQGRHCVCSTARSWEELGVPCVAP